MTESQPEPITSVEQFRRNVYTDDTSTTGTYVPGYRRQPPPSDTLIGTYPLNCHCNAIRLTITLSPPLIAPPDDPDAQVTKINKCNCSVCVKNGYYLVYPLADNVTWEGDSREKVKEYRFATTQKPHWYCGDCGSSLGIDLSGLDMWKERDEKPRVAINARMFKDVALDKWQYMSTRGWEQQQPQYSIPRET